MIYLTGSTNTEDEPGLIAAGVGLVVSPLNSYHLRVDRYPWFGAENGCFTDHFSEDHWIDWLARLPRDRCLYAAAPDVYPDAEATLVRSEPWFPIIREMGFPVALVAQDGAEDMRLPWDDFDCLFIGGQAGDPRREWKVSLAAEQLAGQARRHGKWVHMGRVNSLYRLERARQMCCNSADGTYLKYRRRRKGGGDGPRGAFEIAGWHSWLFANQPLPTPIEGPSHPTHRAAFA